MVKVSYSSSFHDLLSFTQIEEIYPHTQSQFNGKIC